LYNVNIRGDKLFVALLRGNIDGTRRLNGAIRSMATVKIVMSDRPGTDKNGVQEVDTGVALLVTD